MSRKILIGCNASPDCETMVAIALFGMAQCPLLAQSGHGLVHCTCPLSGVKRTTTDAEQPCRLRFD